MRISLLFAILWLALFSASCRKSHEKMKEQFHRIKAENTEPHQIVYTYATYLSTVKSIEPEDAISMLSEMISYGYPTEARYSIDNLKRNGIHSFDLLALRGLCYQNEMQMELALTDFKYAHERDPDNEKIKALLDHALGRNEPGLNIGEMLEKAGVLISRKEYEAAESKLNVILNQDHDNHRALYYKSLIRLHLEQYDSSVYFMTFANSSEKLDEYKQLIIRIKNVMAGDKLIVDDPDSFKGYIQKSQGLASVGMYDPAQQILDSGLENNPDNRNLILAKALVWVQAGEQETAKQYLWEQEQRGISIDPSVKQQILKRVE